MSSPSPTPTVPAVRTDDRRLRRWGIGAVLIMFGGLGGWAVLAPLSSAALAPGLIAVERYRKTVQHLEGGIVKTIDVRDGDIVTQDQGLVTLDSTQAKAQLEVVRGQYLISLAREARLLAQRDGLKQVKYPAELLQNAHDPRAEESIRVQTQTFNVRKSAHEGEISLYERQIGQLRHKAHGLQSQIGSHERLVHSYEEELKDFQSLLKEGYAEKQKVRDLERNLANTEGQRGELMSDLAATELQISETELKILQLKKEFQREVAKELSEVQAALFELREKLQSLQDTVTRTVIKAPEPGMVLGLAVHTIGAVIPPGGRLLDIVPQNEKLIVEARLSPLDIDRVRVGQMAEVRFSAFKSRNTPKIEGKLITVSADRLADENGATEQDRAGYYLARVEITPEGLQDLARQNLDLLPGMPAEVLINTGERTLMEYLIDPIRDTFARSLIED
ncbi:HlyD family type I secretion periplasmic adaptor subunit [Methylolobus aquaticus]